MNTYTAYGLTIASELALLELNPAKGAPDVVVVHTVGLEHPTASAGKEYSAEKEYSIDIQDGVARFWFNDAGTFVVREGHRIEIQARPGTGSDLLRLYVQGMMLAMIMHQRGFCVLHASVVEIDGSAVAFLGHVGAGKSSLAAAMHARGHIVVSDDNAVIQFDGPKPVVYPAFPFLKLFPEIATFLGYGRESLRPLASAAGKVAGQVGRKFATGSIPLKNLYILGRAHPPGISSLSQSQTVLQLILNSVPTRWGHPGTGRDLSQCGALASRVPAFRIKSFKTLEELPSLGRILEEHCLSEQDGKKYQPDPMPASFQELRVPAI